MELIKIINSFPNSLFYMQPSIENIENISLKRKPRAVSTFLKKTFELLNVTPFFISGNLKQRLHQVGPQWHRIYCRQRRPLL